MENFSRRRMNYRQCDQMPNMYVCSIFGHFLQCKLAQKHTELSKVGSKVCQILIKTLIKLSNIFLNFAKVAKFRQIWSH